MDVETIAAKLSEAQREAIKNAVWMGSGITSMLVVEYPGEPWTAPVAQFLTLRADRLTPLGQQVRAHLLATCPDGDT